MDSKVCLLLSVLTLSLCRSYVQGAAYFTSFPKVVYVVSNRTAKFVWDYHVDNRNAEFRSLSPKWSFFNGSNEEVLIQEDYVAAWQWKIATNCPARFRDRVSKESTATLVISKVTLADSGIYGCTLVLRTSSIPNKAELIVTAIPQITLNKNKSVLENGSLSVNCSAIGPPSPNITWIRKGSVLASGQKGSAVLNIYNITRNQSGKYECQARNNPEQPAENQTIIIIVQYPAEFNKGHSTKSIKFSIGEKNVKLKSVAAGVPAPTHVWFLPNKKMVKSENSTESIFEIKEVKEEHIGNWTVNITNGILAYYYVHEIEVTQGSAPTTTSPPVVGCTTAQIVGFVIGFIIAIVIIAVIAVVIYKKKKEKKEWKDWTTLEKVLIVLGFLVAIVIIIVVIVFIARCA